MGRKYIKLMFFNPVLLDSNGIFHIMIKYKAANNVLTFNTQRLLPGLWRANPGAY